MPTDHETGDHITWYTTMTNNFFITLQINSGLEDVCMRTLQINFLQFDWLIRGIYETF